jgi:hypothetical protein
MYLDYVGRETIYGYRAQHGEDLFWEEDFAALQCPDKRRASVPPVWR